MTEKLEANKEQIENLIKDIMEATKHAQRVMFLKMLQEQITRFLQASQVLQCCVNHYLVDRGEMKDILCLAKI